MQPVITVIGTTFVDCKGFAHDIEAERLWESDFGSFSFGQMKNRIAQYAEQDGLPSLVITLGEQGSIYYDKRTGQCDHQSAENVRPVDSSGAGDAFFSGTVAGLTRGLPLSEAVVWGTKVAAWTIESQENTCSSLSKHLRELINVPTTP